MTGSRVPSQTIGRVRATLDAITTAVIAGDDVALLALEGEHVEALGEAMTIYSVEPEDRDALREELANARAALRRCHGTGSAMRHVSATVLGTLGIIVDYDRAGGSADRDRRSSGVNARV